jgi:predicted site-specific integrase-resolvase
MSPVDGVTPDEAANIVGCSRRTLVCHIEAGQLPAGPANQPRRVSRADAEALALASRSSRVGFDVKSSHWVGATAAAELVGVGVARLNQLVAAERIPFEVHTDGRRIYRREQLLTVANSRNARWHGRPRTDDRDEQGWLDRT